ncbi:MAG: DUF3786 domain-containing protein [Bacillota bacterium]
MGMNLEPALVKAREDFGRRDPEAMALNARAVFSQGVFKLSFLGEQYMVHYPRGEIKSGEREGDVGRATQVILLHYFAYSTPAVPEGGLISFKELPGGSIYVGPFTNRVIRPLLKYFGQQPEKLLAAGQKMGGEAGGIGDFSMTIPVLPKIPVTFVIWAGDEEFPPAGNVLFDSSAARHLPTEDYVVLCGLVLDRLRKLGGA